MIGSPPSDVRPRWLRLFAWTAMAAVLPCSHAATPNSGNTKSASHLVVAGDVTGYRAAEHVTLTNGFDLICDRREALGDRVRLYTAVGGTDFVEVAAAEVASVETVMLPVPASRP